MYDTKTLVRISWVASISGAGAGRVISKLVTFANTVLTVKFFRIPMDKAIANTYF